jgi:AraC-like DNA-binding protein
VTLLRSSYWQIYYWQHANLSFPYWRLYWNSQKGASVTLNNITTSLHQNNLLLIPPNTPFASSLDINRKKIQKKNLLIGNPVGSNKNQNKQNLSSINHLFVHFTAGLPYDTIKPNIFTIHITGQTKRLIQKITSGLAVPANDIPHSVNFNIHSLISYGLGSIDESCWPRQINDKRIRAVTAHIEKNFTGQISNKELADFYGMATNAFARLFKKHIGLTIQEYITQKRLSKACSLLHHTNLSIEEIAEETGFCDRYYFSRVFNKHYNCGPSAFRKSSFS